MPKTSKATQAPEASPDLFAAFSNEADKQAEQLSGNARFTPIYIKTDSVKGEKGGKVGVIQIVDPDIRDEDGKPKITQVDELPVVLLAHDMTRAVRYRDAQSNFRTECFSVGPKKQGIGIGTLHGRPMSCLDCQAAHPDGFERDFIDFGSDVAKRGMVKCGSRYFAVVALPEEHWKPDADGNPQPTLAMAYLSMTSVYGITIRDKADVEDKAKTLLSYPDKEAKEHKGVLHELLTRPWELGQANGQEGEKTPQSAIWLNLTAQWLGDSQAPVHAFEIGAEATVPELKWIHEAREQARALMQEMIGQRLQDAYPTLGEAKREALAQSASDQKYSDFGEGVRLALPVIAEEVSDEEAEAVLNGGEQPAASPAAPPPAANSKLDLGEEFPPEEDLPF